MHTCTHAHQVHFRFPETSSLTPPILGLYNINFNYEGQPPLFKEVEFGIDMSSRYRLHAMIHGSCNIFHAKMLRESRPQQNTE